MENQKIYTFQYLWQIKDGDDKKTCVKIVTDVMAGHLAFKQMLKESPDVIQANCVYLNEYDVSRLEQYEIVKEVDKNETN